ncbi:hypothetical protein DENIT_11674 [Pseudomonas veronii]|nr:hypothetical protein DENIT_11674 [Pseudomonas veronii]SEB72073.1 hypothetical protein SAMN04490199_2437 [Pseudomonas marginalis]
MACWATGITSRSPFSDELLSAVQSGCTADAMLYQRITSYRAYNGVNVPSYMELHHWSFDWSKTRIVR